MLVRERGKCQCREGGHDHERGVEEYQASLGKEAIF